jgi:hypothetical protein
MRNLYGYVIWYIQVLAGLVLISILVPSRGDFLLSAGLGAVAVILLQWVMTFPHELGHALAARAVGCSNVRISIGWGRPVLDFEFLRVRWLIHKIPMGGFALFDSEFRGPIWKYVVIVAGGPAVSMLGISAVWLFFPEERWLPGIQTWPGIFFWANVWVLLVTVVPYRFEDAHGSFANDGMLILQALFPNRFTKGTSQNKGNVGLQILRWAGVFFTGGISVGAAVLLFLLLRSSFPASKGPAEVGIVVFAAVALVTVSSYLGRFSYRLASKPIVLEEKPRARTFGEELMERGLGELGALSVVSKDKDLTSMLHKASTAPAREGLAMVESALERFPGDPWLALAKFGLQQKTREAVAAETTLREAAGAELPLAAKFSLAIYEVQSKIELGDFCGAEKIGEEWMESDAGVEWRATMCEYLACLPLYVTGARELTAMEKWARRGLELRPNDPSMNATMGGILVEMERFAEAEPLLVGRIESAPQLHNRAFAMYYVGLIRAAQGRIGEARKLLERATILSDAEWLVRRVKEKLRSWDEGNIEARGEKGLGS